MWFRVRSARLVRAVKLITVKNKVAPPLRSCEIRLVYGHGFASQSQ